MKHYSIELLKDFPAFGDLTPHLPEDWERASACRIRHFQVGDRESYEMEAFLSKMTVVIGDTQAIFYSRGNVCLRRDFPTTRRDYRWQVAQHLYKFLLICNDPAFGHPEKYAELPMTKEMLEPLFRIPSNKVSEVFLLYSRDNVVAYRPVDSVPDAEGLSCVVVAWSGLDPKRLKMAWP